MFLPKIRSLPNDYVEVIVNPAQIWKPSINMIFWPTMTRVRSYIELHRFPIAESEDDSKLIIHGEFGRFEISIKEQLSVGRGSRRVPILMGPFTAEMPPEIHNLKQEIADLFVKGKKIDWRGPEDLRGWWD